MNEGNLEIRPGGLDVLSTGLNLAELDLHGGDGFWEEIRRYARDSLLEAQVDRAMGGRAAPRVWAFLESPGSGPAAAAAALGTAYLLADRGQAVVLVDADENEPRVTRWLGRTEMEGWIDMIRFGASLHAASDALPSDSRRGSVLGVGSFAPTGVTPEEVAELLGRLRRQADDLVLVLPAKLRSAPWLEAADIRLLCWDLLTRGADDTEKIVTEMERMDARPDALVGFGVEEFVAIQDSLVETAAGEPEAEPGPAPMPEAEDEPESADAPEPVATREPVDAGAATEPAIAEPAAAEPAADGIGAPEPAIADVVAEPGPGRSRRTSGIFVFVAVAAVACLALLGVFLAGQIDGGDDGGADAVATGQAEVQDVPVVAGSVDIPAAGTPGDEARDVAVAREDEPDGAEDGTIDPVAIPQDAAPGDAQPAPEPEATEPPADEAAVDADVAPQPEPETMDWAPFRKPAGQDGWALWLTSFPSAADADAEIARLGGLGIRATSRAVEIKDRGRWFRVYAGSFADRAAAKAVVEDLKAELKHDWVVPARF